MPLNKIHYAIGCPRGEQYGSKLTEVPHTFTSNGGWD
jgi:hypothetical protein